MPRRALALITALVLALHWLVLSGVPLAWDSPVQPGGRVFSTRSIAAPAPPPPPPPAATAPAVPAAPRSAAPPRPPQRPKPPARPARPAAPVEDTAPATVPAVNDAPDPGAEGLTDVAMAAPAETLVPPEEPTAAAEASATPAEPAASAPVQVASASPPPNSEPVAGVDISPPGPAGTGHAPSTAPPPVRLPPPTRLIFEVSGQAKKFAYSARAELLWQHDGSRYQARQEVSAFLVGSRSQSSVGQISAQGLLPERFSDRARSEQAAHFDYAKGRVTFSANTPDAPMGPGSQDRLSVFIQLGALLAADPGRFVPGTQITLTTVSARSADRWTFNVEAPETLDLPAGATATLKLQRLPRKDYDQKAELWVAPALGYLPVRIRLTQANGDFADLQLRSSSAP
ncbi:MAG: DUF3108 domain-containing protein [Gammaproteobacteria bacterium]|nr:DUF3108 domain-containing protein [Gammaproteobacteria bacterium]MBU1507245.1 DUF3108 domain-containing protein [Gammaproteobacteria bacterium]MBU2121231.1 DUF3108 domain-containing protein [Gammaproteobacteria bacterium]MBU2171150.1 DUF3108 domain-containing protein [Gammaproteobacteria bacterium]MBU2201694.1 DUF3108 domain-containing protein [Gammaproteobacteria bacterium]